MVVNQGSGHGSSSQEYSTSIYIDAHLKADTYLSDPIKITNVEWSPCLLMRCASSVGSEIVRIFTIKTC